MENIDAMEGKKQVFGQAWGVLDQLGALEGGVYISGGDYALRASSGAYLSGTFVDAGVEESNALPALISFVAMLGSWKSLSQRVLFLYRTPDWSKLCHLYACPSYAHASTVRVSRVGSRGDRIA